MDTLYTLSCHTSVFSHSLKQMESLKTVKEETDITSVANLVTLLPDLAAFSDHYLQLFFQTRGHMFV